MRSVRALAHRLQYGIGVMEEDKLFREQHEKLREVEQTTTLKKRKSYPLDVMGFPVVFTGDKLGGGDRTIMVPPGH